MAKEIHLQVSKAGNVRRYRYYDDLRAAGCARGLLVKYGWNVRPVKYLPAVGKYKVFANLSLQKQVKRSFFIMRGIKAFIHG